jgi:hypothetical protein
MNRRQLLFRMIGGGLAAGGLAAGAARPAQAQDMGDNGWVLPSFFFSREEQRAREACINRSPNCRPAVRDRLDLERGISLLLPWALLTLGFVGLLIHLRRREMAKEAARRAAQRKHVPGGFRKLDKVKSEAERADADNGDDRFN